MNNIKKIGLSERKASYLINLSEKLKNFNSYDYWNNLNDQEIYSFLIDIKGIGPWSIKMFMIFCLNRPDIFSADDIGLLKAMGKNYFNNIQLKEDTYRPLIFGSIFYPHNVVLLLEFQSANLN